MIDPLPSGAVDRLAEATDGFELLILPSKGNARPPNNVPLNPEPDGDARRLRSETIMAKESKQLDELFHDTLKDIYFAEKKILATLPKMAKAAQSPDLRKAFEKHRGETEGHVARLENVFAAIDKKPQGKTCEAIVDH
jgi:hypothetical protein